MKLSCTDTELINQGIDIALSKLEQGDWVHIFPEGSRSRDGGKSIGTVRRGIGRWVGSLALSYCAKYESPFMLLPTLRDCILAPFKLLVGPIIFLAILGV